METEKITWGDVEHFAKEHKLGIDEYFLLDMATSSLEPVWAPEVKQVVIYLAPGTNEGFYVTVGVLSRESPWQKRGFSFVSMAGGKYWSPEAALRAVRLLTAFIYGITIQGTLSDVN